jgi:plastocyanin
MPSQSAGPFRRDHDSKERMIMSSTRPMKDAARRWRVVAVVSLVAGLALLAAACEQDQAGAGMVLPSAGERFVTTQLIEFPWKRHVDRTAFPDPDPRDLFSEYDFSGDDGYILHDPDEDGEWEVGAYVFLPSHISLTEGDRVTMELLGVRGDEHELFLDIPGQEEEITVRRGHLEVVEFTAPEPGVYEFICETHPPTMTMYIYVFPGG